MIEIHFILDNHKLNFGWAFFVCVILFNSYIYDNESGLDTTKVSMKATTIDILIKINNEKDIYISILSIIGTFSSLYIIFSS